MKKMRIYFTRYFMLGWIGWMLAAPAASAQSYVTIIYDANHLAIVNENGAVRLAAEISHNAMLKEIKERIEDINVNLSSVVLVQQIIHRSLTEVNEALKSGRAVMRVGELLQEIVSEATNVIELAKGDPILLLFAEGIGRELKDRGVRLVADVSNFVLKEGGNVLMDFEKRDFLLRKITLELQVMRSLLFGMQRSMHYAKINGVFRSLNPYRNFINQDRRIAGEVIRNYKTLRR